VAVEKNTAHKMDKITNQRLLQQAERIRSLIAKIKERKKTWVGHALRSGNLLQRVVEGRIHGKSTIVKLSDLIGKEDLRIPQKKSTR